MKKYLLIPVLFVCSWQVIHAQETGEAVDLLKAPASPASQLLNIAPNAIERPTDLSSLMLSVTNASDGLAKFPTSYALDLSPAALFNSRIITLKDLKSRKTNEVIWQSFVVSTALKQDEDTGSGQSVYKAGIGIKFSIVRPDWTAKTTSNYQEIVAIQRRLTKLITVSLDEVMNDTAYQRLVAIRDQVEDENSAAYTRADEAVNNMFRQLMTEKRTIRMAENAALYTQLKAKARDFKIDRKGFFLDFAGGFSAQFPGNKFNYSLADRSGAWLTGGYEGGEKHFSLLGIGRYLYQPESIFADPTGTIPFRRISTFDAGGRLLYATRDDLFNISVEGIYRSVLNKSIIDPSWRLNFAAEYDLGFNKKLSLNFGRDFDGVVSRGGNLIAALNFIAGFGNKKDLK